jgi:hypothetical protein
MSRRPSAAVRVAPILNSEREIISLCPNGLCLERENEKMQI